MGLARKGIYVTIERISTREMLVRDHYTNINAVLEAAGELTVPEQTCVMRLWNDKPGRVGMDSCGDIHVTMYFTKATS